MALPLLFFIGSSIVRAATPTIARLLVKQGYKKASSAVVKNTLKTAKKIRTIGKQKDIPIAKNKSLTVPKNKSTALTKIDKATGGKKSKLLNGKVIAAASTVASIPALISKDDKKGQAKADTNKKSSSSGMKGGPPQRKAKTKMDVSQGSTAGGNKLTFGKAFRAAKDAGKKEFTYRGKRYNTRTKDENKKAEAVKKFGMGKVDSLPKSKVEKKKARKTDNMEGGTAPIKDKKAEPKKSKSFLDRVKSDFNKAVKETKRNFSGDLKKKTGKYKLVDKKKKAS
tara:strand:+ start:630 stop:1475 length:846 start_codon:yes stop_codon:yes gene_type:complete